MKYKRNIFKKIAAVASIGIMITVSYWIGKMQVDHVDCKVADIDSNVVSDGYIDLSSEEFQKNYIDMRNVVDYSVNEYGLQLYLEDGTGYYWER